MDVTKKTPWPVHPRNCCYIVAISPGKVDQHGLSGNYIDEVCSVFCADDILGERQVCVIDNQTWLQYLNRCDMARLPVQYADLAFYNLWWWTVRKNGQNAFCRQWQDAPNTCSLHVLCRHFGVCFFCDVNKQYIKNVHLWVLSRLELTILEQPANVLSISSRLS